MSDRDALRGLAADIGNVLQQLDRLAPVLKAYRPDATAPVVTAPAVPAKPPARKPGPKAMPPARGTITARMLVCKRPFIATKMGLVVYDNSCGQRRSPPPIALTSRSRRDWPKGVSDPRHRGPPTRGGLRAAPFFRPQRRASIRCRRRDPRRALPAMPSERLMGESYGMLTVLDCLP